LTNSNTQAENYLLVDFAGDGASMLFAPTALINSLKRESLNEAKSKA
jgi:hypothetical protein